MSKTSLKVVIGSCTEQGVKAANEDCLGAFIPEKMQLIDKGIILVIADGMSGSDAGKQASTCCVNSFLNDYYSTPDSWSVKKSGKKILSATNSWLYSQGHIRFNSSKGLVSTLTALVLKSTTGHIFHVGDSRVYRLRKENLELMTRDHRVILSENKNYLNRAMGVEPLLEVDYKAFPLEVGDLFLMVTDGIHDFLDDKAIKKALKNEQNLDEMAKNLVKLAIEEKSNDNLSCQLLRIKQLPLATEYEIIRHHANIPFPPFLEAGMILDDYRIVSELHANKRTQIYKAVDIQSNTYVILKTPSVLFDDDKKYIERFLHEEWAGKRIEHKNVLKVLDADRKKSFIYYVTEFVEGETLRDWIDQHEKPLIRDVRKIIKQVAAGLNAFHRMEMLHQDLKPENIMLTTDGTVKIIDFGSVKIAGIADSTRLEKNADNAENVLGTLNYTAPEYYLGQRGTIQSDLYSLGVVTYEMINKSLPFGKEMPEKPNEAKLAKLQYIPSIQVNSMVPRWIDGALKKATQINPKLRYEEIFEFIHDITSPNPMFLKENQWIPLVERNSLVFWKTIATILLLGNLVLLYFLSLS